MTELDTQQANHAAHVNHTYVRPSVIGYSMAPQDLAGVAGEMVAAGLSVLEAQQLVALIQEIAQNAAMAAMPRLLEAVRKTNEQRFRDLYRDVSMMPNRVGHLQRDVVLRAITAAMHTPAQR